MLDFTTATDTTTIAPAIAAAAGFVASATARLEMATAALSEAEDAARHVRDRIAALTAERQTIVQRRAAGQSQQSDAGRLALIAADLEGLAAIASETDAAAAAEHAKVEAEQRLVDQARARFARAEDEAALAALTEHARKLDGLLVASLAEARQVYVRLGIGKPPFAPSPALVTELRKVAAAHGML